MKLNDFRQKANTYHRRTALSCILPLCAAFIWLVVYVPCRPCVEAKVKAWFASAWAEALLAALILCPVLLAFIVMIPLTRRTNRRFGLPCPHCQKYLVDHSRIVIASRNCPYCGQRVLDD